MAQSGYTPILLYASGTATNVPLAANMTSSSAGAELALNYADGKLYFKNSSGVVTLLASSGTVGGTTFSAGTTGFTPNTATSGAVTLAGTLVVGNGGTGLTSLTAGYIPYGNGTSALSSSSTLTYSGTLLSSTAYLATGVVTGSSSQGVFAYGSLGYTDVNHILTMASSQNSYIQMEIQNTNTGASASSDVIVGNNNTTSTTYYGDFGMNSSGWAGTAGTNSFGSPNMVYMTATTADLLIGTTTANTIRLAVGGGADSMQVNGTTGIVSFPTTTAITLPNGTTGQQPTGVAGMLRFNSTTTQFEGYNGTTWASVGGASLSNDTSSSTPYYPLFARATSGTALTIYTSNANYLYTPSSGQLQAPELYASNGLIANSLTVSASYTIPSGASAVSVGPVSVATGQSVTVPTGSRWVVL